MRIATLVAGALAWTGCYKPGVENSCTVTCSPLAPCSNGLACELGRCRDPAGPPCTFDAGPVDAAADDPDAYRDAPADASTAPDALIPDAPPDCFGVDPYTSCPPLPLPMTDWTVTDTQQIQTDTDPLCAAAVPGYCVIAFRTITINGTLVGLGSRPLVLVGTAGITVNTSGVIDVSSDHNVSGAGSKICPGGTNGGTTASAGGGGAGGTFSGRGGFGGSSGGASGGTPAASPSTLVSGPRGGCQGTDGGGSNGSSGGRGGGGMVLISGGPIEVIGKLLARGSGGHLGAQGGGGGGGGSGGLIALDGQTVVVTGSMIAAGGGGGGGGSSSDAGGNGGQASVLGSPASGGVGGPGTPAGGNGGNGSGPATLRNGLGGMLVSPSASGGGGGGGAGVNQLRGMVTITGSVIVPPPS